ncbi:MAG: hypothetical protein H6Q74_2287 [Firmicutes bacterium]|nr:hypothetical protein [Bacillota bacterium]
MNFIDVYENDSGNLIDLPVAATLRVILEENPSTGYRWKVEDQSSGCLEMVSHEFYINNDHIVGAGGLVVFYFQPMKPGRCTLYLKLGRPWEGDKAITKRFRIAVFIR